MPLPPISLDHAIGPRASFLKGSEYATSRLGLVRSPPNNPSPSPPSTSENGGGSNGDGGNSNIYNDWHGGYEYSQHYDDDRGTYNDYNGSSKEMLDGILRTSYRFIAVVIMDKIITLDDVLMIREHLLGGNLFFLGYLTILSGVFFV